MKPNITPVTLTSEKGKARLLNTLFKAKLLALLIQLADLPKWYFRCTLSSGNFQCNYFSGFLFAEGSEILYNKASLSSTRKTLQLLCALQTGFSEKIENVQEKCKCRCPQ